MTGGGNVLYIDSMENLIIKMFHICMKLEPQMVGAVTMACSHEILFREIGEERLAKIIKTVERY